MRLATILLATLALVSAKDLASLPGDPSIASNPSDAAEQGPPIWLSTQGVTTINGTPYPLDTGGVNNGPTPGPTPEGGPVGTPSPSPTGSEAGAPTVPIADSVRSSSVAASVKSSSSVLPSSGTNPASSSEVSPPASAQSSVLPPTSSAPSGAGAAAPASLVLLVVSVTYYLV